MDVIKTKTLQQSNKVKSITTIEHPGVQPQLWVDVERATEAYDNVWIANVITKGITRDNLYRKVIK